MFIFYEKLVFFLGMVDWLSPPRYVKSHIIGIMRGSDRYDFRYRMDAVRRVSDEPSPTLARAM